MSSPTTREQMERALASYLRAGIQPYQRPLFDLLSDPNRDTRHLAIVWPRRSTPRIPRSLLVDEDGSPVFFGGRQTMTHWPEPPTADRTAPDWAPRLTTGRVPR